jgi:hypothetical protein
MQVDIHEPRVTVHPAGIQARRHQRPCRPPRIMPARRRPRLLTTERRPVQQPNWPRPIATSILEPREYSPRSAALALFIRCAGLPCASHLAEDDDLARLPHRWSSRTQNFHAWLLLLVLFIYANKDSNSVQVKRKNGSNDFTAEVSHSTIYVCNPCFLIHCSFYYPIVCSNRLPDEICNAAKSVLVSMVLFKDYCTSCCPFDC